MLGKELMSLINEFKQAEVIQLHLMRQIIRLECIITNKTDNFIKVRKMVLIR